MKKIDLKSLTPHLIAIAIFWVLTAAYFLPLFQGKSMQQSDVRQWEGAAKEILDVREHTGKEALWTNSMFSGMPAFQISVLYKGNLLSWVDKGLQILLPSSANLVFIPMIGFYLLLILLGIESRLAIAGAIGVAFATYNLCSIETGHNTKVLAMAYMPLVIAGVLMAYRNHFVKGALVTAVALSLQIYANHLQITYYLFITIVLLVFAELFSAIREKRIPQFIKASLVLAVAGALAVGTNFSNLWATYEYGKYTTRGQSELTAKKVSSGLDKDYALGWSYGKAETLTLLFPDCFGGSSQHELSENSESYKTLIAKGVPPGQAESFIRAVPLYWGDQPFTSGPVYIGALFCFLFVLGLFIVKGPVKWWLLAATILSIVLSWGKNFPPVTDFFFDFVPAYNKFRSVSMTLVIAGITIPLLAMLALHTFLEATDSNKKNEQQVNEIQKYFLYALYIVGGFCLLFAVWPGLFFNFIASSDEQMISGGYPEWLIAAIRSDRESLFRTDAMRSLALILAGAGLMWLMMKKKIKKEYVIVVVSFLVLVDMWTVGKRYLNDSSFVPESNKKNEFVQSTADQAILADKDPDFRVMNLAANTFNDGITSYYHKSIGGYHGAKLKRYQELIENQISKNNYAVLNMLNTKYFILRDEKTKEPRPQRNPDALGNAWFVQEYKLAANADSEMNALSNFNPAMTAIVDQRYANELSGLKPVPDSASFVKLISYAPDQLKYESKSVAEQLCVFSEIYYEKGWHAFVDGKETPIIRANYVLRSMRIPAGSHQIEFRFEPACYYTGEKISLGSSLLVLLLAAGAGFASFRNKTNNPD